MTAGPDPAHATALLDWLGCAVRGAREPAALAAAEAGDRVAALGTAGHVLDYDDTFPPGLAHLSAPTAPVALALAAECGATTRDALSAFAAGFEEMGAQARACHPALYERGWHPTAVCGSAGAAVTAGRLLGLDPEGERTAVALALLRASGLRAAFGSDGKALQVGMAAATGLHAARLAEAGASVPLGGAAEGFEAAFGARLSEPTSGLAVSENWIKAWPCCLQTHGPIEAADRARAEGFEPGEPVRVVVHPRSLQAARYGAEVADGLQAKFSIPYCTAHALLHGPPRVDSFAAVDPGVAVAARDIEVSADSALAESEAVLAAGGREVRVVAALGSPQRPLAADAMAAKLDDLAGDRLDGALEDLDRPAAELLASAGLG